jgi:hypothetical protein
MPSRPISHTAEDGATNFQQACQPLFTVAKRQGAEVLARSRRHRFDFFRRFETVERTTGGGPLVAKRGEVARPKIPAQAFISTTEYHSTTTSRRTLLAGGFFVGRGGATKTPAEREARLGFW